MVYGHRQKSYEEIAFGEAEAQEFGGEGGGEAVEFSPGYGAVGVCAEDGWLVRPFVCPLRDYILEQVTVGEGWFRRGRG